MLSMIETLSFITSSYLSKEARKNVLFSLKFFEVETIKILQPIKGIHIIIQNLSNMTVRGVNQRGERPFS